MFRFGTCCGYALVLVFGLNAGLVCLFGFVFGAGLGVVLRVLLVASGLFVG